MPKSSIRLQKIIDEIDNAKAIADIGTDHGYLPIMAIEQHRALKAYASDIAYGPLQIARNNIEAANMAAEISLILADGLTYYADRNIELDYAIIAGLGSATISEILFRDYENIDNYLICSNTEPSAILKVAKKKRLRVAKEAFFFDNGRKYWLLKLSRDSGLKIKSFKDIYVGMDSVLNDSNYLQLLSIKYKENLLHLTHLKRLSKRYKFLKKLNKNIKEVLDDDTRKNS